MSAAAQLMAPRPGDWLRVCGFLWIGVMPIAAFALAGMNYKGLDLACRTVAWPYAWMHSGVERGREEIARRHVEEMARGDLKYAIKRNREIARFAHANRTDRPAAD